nr:retrovirus-related Pol polyprotein from transposon TNT 1-94 [Tanacetum cinerariifolium]
MLKLDLEPLAPKLLQNKEAHIDYLKYTQEQVDILQGIVKQAKAKQPLDNAAKKVAVTPKNKVKKVWFTEPLTSSSNIKRVESSKTSDSNTLVLSPIGLKCSTSDCISKPTCNKKNDRISQTPSRNTKNKVKAQRRNVNKKNRVVETIRDVDVKQSQLNANSKLICSTCKKSMFDGVHDLCILKFVKNVNSRAKSAKKHKKQNIWKPTVMYSLKTKDEAPEAIIKCTKNIQVRLNATVRNNNIVKRQNQTLVEAVRKMLIFSKAPLFLLAEAINTACYTQNCSIIRRRYNRTPYELMQDKKPNLSFFYVFGALFYPTNDNDDLGKLDAKAGIGIFVGYALAKKAFIIYNKRTQKIIETIHVTFDKLIAMASEQFSSGPRLHCMTPATFSLELVPNIVSQQPCTPLNRVDWDHLFQPMFDEYFNPPSIDVPPVQEAVALRAMDLADSLVLTFIDQDATSSTNMIRDPSCSVSTRKQLKTDAMWCYFDAFLTSIEPKNFKQAMTEPSWIDAMQEEIHEFERIEVWELVSCLDKVILIKLKWIYKVKTDEFGGVLKNKARLVAQGFRLKEEINFKESFAPDTSISLTTYADADHAGCQETRRNTSGSAQFLGDKLVKWSSKKQKAKYIDVRYHFLKEQVENEVMELVRTEYQLADNFTKPLPRERFNFLIDKLGMRSMSPETLKRLAYETNE